MFRIPLPKVISTRPRPSSRGQASVIGLVLILALTVLGTTAIITFGSQSLSTVEDQASIERVEQVFGMLDARTARVALGESGVATVQTGLSLDRGGTLRTRPTGEIEITTDGGTTIVDRPLGTVEYRGRGTVIAYQGGGVWRGEGNESVMVSPPEFHYREGTLTLPVIAVDGASGGQADRITVRKQSALPLVGPGRVQGETVTIEISGRYYVGWARYLDSRIDGLAVTVDHSTETVTARLGHARIDNEFERGIVAQGPLTVDTPHDVETEATAAGGLSGSKPDSVDCAAGTGADCVTSDTVALDDLDTEIESQVTSARDTLPDANVDHGPRTLTSGAYFSEGFHLDNGDLTLDLAAGNVTLIVDGNIGVDNHRIRVVNGGGTNHVARVYTTGDVAIAKGQAGVTVSDDEAQRFQLYGTSEIHFGMGQANVHGFTGVIYAPRDAAATGDNEAVDEYTMPSATAGTGGSCDVCLGTGSGEFNGAVVSGPVTVSQGGSFDYEEDLSTVRPTLPSAADGVPPPLTYLHISVNVVEIEGPVAG